MAWGRRVRIFWKFFGGAAGCRKLLCAGERVRSVRLQVAIWERSEECAQVAIFNVCNEWRICSVWQVAWERMNGCSYVIERTMQSSPLLREGGLRNDAAGAALWRTRPYECAIDVCQLLTIVIADVCRELSFHLYWFATNSGFVRFDNVVNRMETFERETTYE